MNRRIFLIVILVGLGVVAWQLKKGSSTTSLDRALSDFAISDTASVDRIHISDRKGAVVDLRRTADGWVLNGKFKPRHDRVDLLLRTFKRIEVRSPVPKSAEEYMLRVMASSSRKVEIYQGGKEPSKIWIVGHATKDHFGTYMLLEKPDEGRSSSPFEMKMTGFTGILNTRFETELDGWRDQTVFSFPDLFQLAAVESEQPLNAKAFYRLEQAENGDVRALDNKGRPLGLEPTLAKAALLPYGSMNYEYIVRNMKQAQRDSLLSAMPNHVIRVFARNGTVQEVKLWYMPYLGDQPTFDVSQPLYDVDRMYGLVQDSLITVVQRATFNAVLQPAQAMMP